MSDKNQYITFFTFSISNYIFLINDFSTLSSNLNSNSNANIFTSISIDELITNFIVQKIGFFNSINVKQKTFDRHSKFRFVKNFFVNLLIDLIVIERIVLVKANSIIVKATLILFVKAILIDFYEFKSYKEIIIDAQHKINWQLIINDKTTFYKNNQIWILMNSASKNRKIFIDKWIYKCKKNINEKIIRYKIRWCVRNFEQLKNLNYHEIFVSMIKFMNYKVIFVIIVVNNWNIEQMNVKIVFFMIMCMRKFM